MEKTCARCKVTQPIDNFYMRPSRGPNARISYCKDCQKKKDAERYQSDGEKIKAYRKKYYAENKEQVLAANKVTWAKNKEKYKPTNKAWHEANPNWRKEYNTKYYAEKGHIQREKINERRRIDAEAVRAEEAARRIANPDAHRAKDSRRRARKAAAGGSYTAADIAMLKKHQKNQCAVCRCSIESGYHIDHIQPIARGGSNDKTNLQLLCPPCNLAKNSKDPIDFMQSKGFLL